ncbi:flagellar assembly protein FliW [Kineococcus indalonis]|uniref:flagellar assembly protein FliW n=1 Tax=Kineococcus indalonis TaxID=2696566 RepID=UPI00196B9999|nr:flagellar assembly protein FliW [Kineococcus indalonis]
MTDTNAAAEIEFVAPLSGLPEHTRFTLAPLDEDGLLFSLRSTEDPGLRLLVVTPERFFPDYSPVVDAGWAEELELSGPEDAALLVVVNPGSGLADATANLLAPVVLNHRTSRAAQIVLTGSDLPLRAPLLPV